MSGTCSCRRVYSRKGQRVLTSSRGEKGRQPFDEASARDLFLYLIAPFEAQLNQTSVKQIMIVPQGRWWRCRSRR